MATNEKPLPHESEDSRTYWAKAKDGVLALQRCANCGRLRHYPRLVCDNCYSLESEWIDASGRGVLHSWTVAHHAFHPGFAGDVPYVLATVDLEEGPRALGILDCPADVDFKRGMALAARFVQRADGMSELHFSPARQA